MRLSLHITDFAPSTDPAGMGAWLARIARAADESDLDTLWVSDHLLQADPSSNPDAHMLEAYTTLGFLSAQTQRIRLGTMVTAVTYRAPALLVKSVTTLDVLSGGRAWLGSEPDITKVRRPRWAWTSRLSANDSNGWKRRCASRS